MSASLRIVSLNIERSNHLNLIVPFFEEHQADVVCIQELYERDIPELERTIGPCAAFAPSGRHPTDPPEQGSQIIGEGLFTKLPVVRNEISYYAGNKEKARTDEPRTITRNLGVIVCDVEKGEDTFRIGTLHFMWTPDGKPTDEQRRCLAALLPILQSYGDMVFTGDMNAPRGGEIFTEFASRYKDNVPSRYTSSLDPQLHRAGPLELMVDGIFSTPAYTVSAVEMVSGVSDHCALVATVSKR